MLLKSDLTGADNRPIEQVMFTQLEIGNAIPEAELEPSLTGDGYAWFRQNDAESTAMEDSGPRGWEVRRVPAGFRMTHHQRKRMQPGSEGTVHMVFSDGLATVSVYVESSPAAGEAFSGPSSMGAMNAFGSLIDGHQVTVVGEVPAVTVEMMAQSVVAREGAAGD